MYHVTIEIDSYDDTAVYRSNFTVLNYTSQECDVVLFDSKDVKKIMSTSNCEKAWNNSSGTTCMIKINQALCMGDCGMKHSLLNPNKLRNH